MTAHVTDADKADAIFAVLSELDEGVGLTKAELEEETGFSSAQFRAGWYRLRRDLGNLALVEPHREDTIYRLSSDYSDGAADRYRLWQGKNTYRRLWSHLATLGQMARVATQTDPNDGENIRLAEYGLRDALAALKVEVRRAGQRADVPVEQIEAWLVDAEDIKVAV
jgi:hypothetical protein